jgi:hypothetical protein
MNVAPQSGTQTNPKPEFPSPQSASQETPKISAARRDAPKPPPSLVHKYPAPRAAVPCVAGGYFAQQNCAKNARQNNGARPARHRLAILRSLR